MAEGDVIIIYVGQEKHVIDIGDCRNSSEVQKKCDAYADEHLVVPTRITITISEDD